MSDNESKGGERERAYELRRKIPEIIMPPRPNLPSMPPESSSSGLSFPYCFNDEYPFAPFLRYDPKDVESLR